MTQTDFEIDPQRISERAQVLEGSADLEELAEVADSLANTDGELRYKVTAELDPHHRKVVSCIIEGFVFLMCQKTLEAFRHDISINDRLVLVDHESALPPIEEEEEGEDYVVADGPIDVLDLVEEAVLLALPMVPRKPGLEPGDGEPEKTQRESPFAALERLKKKTD
jgi:uncharacterized protein